MFKRTLPTLKCSKQKRRRTSVTKNINENHIITLFTIVEKEPYLIAKKTFS